MGFTKENAVTRARIDLARRLKIDADDIDEKSISDKEFPDMSLGAPAAGEMSAQMIAYGWIIKLAAKGKTYEYRADKYQIRLHNFNGENYVVV
ncbi:MAG: hypothetical protein ABL999_11430 [Pyrinomonadaceae bacterium]